MHADTDAIRAYGSVTTAMSTDLRAAAAVLTEDVTPTVLAAFGAVGARFAEALADAAAGLVGRVGLIADDVTNSSAAATATANAYDDVEHRSQAELARTGM
jgi:hypothetical protein